MLWCGQRKGHNKRDETRRIEQYKEKSIELQDEVKRRLGQTVPWRHDVIVHHLGLNGLIAVGKGSIKPIFESVVEQIASKFGAVAMLPGVKGPKRAGIKVRTRYGGDASHLSDIVRATLKFKMGPDVLDKMYGAVEDMLFMSELHGARCSVTLFTDRYQHPFAGGYRDLLMLFKINGYACELQLNIDEILVIKEGSGHKQYEFIRKVNDDLLDAAMRSDTLSAKMALGGKADPNAPRDMYGLTPLHYAANHDNAEMVNYFSMFVLFFIFLCHFIICVVTLLFYGQQASE